MTDQKHRKSADTIDADEVVRAWLMEDPDPDTRVELESLLATHDTAGISDRFGGRLEFGTAGLRGALGAGPNRMNRAVVRGATAALAGWLRERTAAGPPNPVDVALSGSGAAENHLHRHAAVTSPAEAGGAGAGGARKSVV